MFLLEAIKQVLRLRSGINTEPAKIIGSVASMRLNEKNRGRKYVVGYSSSLFDRHSGAIPRLVLNLSSLDPSLRSLYFESSRGKNREKAVPLLPKRVVLDTRRSPCSRSTSWADTHIPRPVPVSFLVVKNGS